MTEALSALYGAIGMALVVGLFFVTRPWRILSIRARMQQRRRLWQDAMEQVGDGASMAERARSILLKLERAEADARRKADEYFEKIRVVEAERNHWQSLYYQCAIEYGNAQEMLMNERRQNARRMLAVGKDPFVDPRVESVVQACHDEHHGPALEAMRKVTEAANMVQSPKGHQEGEVS